MIDDLRHSTEYIEELENELQALRQSHNSISNELTAVYSSKAYKFGSVARIAYKDPKRIAKKAAKLIKNTGKLSPAALSHFKAATPHNSAIVGAAYKQWQADFEPKEVELDDQRKHAKELGKQPLFSIITPVFKPPKEVLIELIESVMAQTYPNFELCLGEFSGDSSTIEILQQYSKKDSRIKVKIFNTNEGISINSNRCLDIATGDYVALLDHDDTLSPDALYENALLINEKDYDFIYSDKDKIDEAGNRFDPMFKPHWSPELMLTANYLTHFNVFKRSLVDKIGGWDKSTDGAQDWDLFLRLIVESKLVGHIPKILYHWRVLATSTAHSISTKPYALGGQKRAITKYVESLGVQAPNITHSKEGALSLEWGKSDKKNRKIEIIIHGDPETIGSGQRISKKLLKLTDPGDVSLTFIDRESPEFSKLVNSKKNNCDILIFIDSRVIGFGRKSLVSELLGWLTIPGVGISSPQSYTKYGVFLEAGRILGLGASAAPLFAGENYIPGIFGYREWSRNVSMPSFHCFAVKAESIKHTEITQQGIQALREVALHSLKNGYRTVVTPFDSVVVDRSALFEPAMSKINSRLIKSVYPELIDPYFSVNLSAEKRYPVFITKRELNSRKETIAGYFDKPIEYDPSLSSTDALFAHEETLTLTGYKRDAYILSGSMDFTEENLAKSREITDSSVPITGIESAVWFIPNFDTLYAGLKNIFALASRMTDEEGTKHVFCITANEPVKNIEDMIIETYPNLCLAEFINYSAYNRAYKNKQYTIGICTLWTTAYDLLANNNVKRKFYIIQDDERSFYPRGSIQSLVNSTYDFGFWGIAGTDALREWYETRQVKKGSTVVLSSELELSSYLKATENKKANNLKPRILFYARPDAPRNGFEVGIHGLNRFAKDLNGEVEIVLAGANFSLARYEGLHPSIRTAGKVAYADLPEFYASFDAALFLMFSEHPGVFPIEMMASSVPVVINEHYNASWKELYVNNKTCLTTKVSASSIAETLGKLVSDIKLREMLIKNGRLLAEKQNSFSYAKQANEVIKLIKKGKNS